MIETKNAASPLTDLKTTEEAGKEVLNSDSIQTFTFMGKDIRVISKDATRIRARADPNQEAVIMPGEIIDADGRQTQSAADLRVGKQIGQIDRATEGKSWHIIGAVGPYLKIQTHNNNGGTHTRLISADDYQRCDRYKSRIPVRRYPHAMPIIDADGIQATRSANHRTTQPDIIVAREV